MKSIELVFVVEKLLPKTSALLDPNNNVLLSAAKPPISPVDSMRSDGVLVTLSNICTALPANPVNEDGEDVPTPIFLVLPKNKSALFVSTFDAE